MMRQKLFFALLLLTTQIPAAANCRSTINQINTDINHYTNSIVTQHKPWMNLSWLNGQLGNPEQSKMSANVIQYEWTCPGDTAPTLTVQTDVAQHLIAVKGQYDSASGSGLFAADFSQGSSQSFPLTRSNVANTTATYLPAATGATITASTAAPVVQNDLAEQKKSFATDMARTMESYNQWFDTNITDPGQLTELSLNQVKAYYKKLSSCTPGTYKYPVFNNSFGVIPNQAFYFKGQSTIFGMQNGKCKVHTTVKKPAASDSQSCELSGDTLAYYTAVQAKKDIENQPSDTRVAMNMALNKECRVHFCDAAGGSSDYDCVMGYD